MSRTVSSLLLLLIVPVLCAQTDGTKDEPGEVILPTRIVLVGEPMGIRAELAFANDEKRTLTETLTNTRTGEVFDKRTSVDYTLTLYAEGDVPYGLTTTAGNFDFIPYIIADGVKHVTRLELQADGKKCDAFRLWQRLASKDPRFRLCVKPPPEQEEQKVPRG